jgi:GxxExxY protein
MTFPEPGEELDSIGAAIVDAAYRVWSDVGPGLLESVYQVALSEELRQRGFAIAEKVAVPFAYGDRVVENAYEIDILVNDMVIVELKSTEQDHPVFPKQVLTYLRLTGRRLGFVVNFGAPYFKAGIRRVVNSPPSRDPD